MTEFECDLERYGGYDSDWFQNILNDAIEDFNNDDPFGKDSYATNIFKTFEVEIQHNTFELPFRLSYEDFLEVVGYE